MLSCSRNDVVLVRYPFTDLSAAKVRPAVVVSSPHPSQDVIIVPLTSRTSSLLKGEFALGDWRRAGLHVPTAAKRGVFTIHGELVLRVVGSLSSRDAAQLDGALRCWLGLSD